MAFTWTNNGLFEFINQAITGGSDVRALVITDAAVPLPATIRDLDTVADLLAESGVTEAAVAGYGRTALTGFSVTQDDAGDDVDIVGTFPDLTPAAGETWAAVGYYIEGASDAARVLLGVDEPASTFITNGGTVTPPPLSASLAQA